MNIVNSVVRLALAAFVLCGFSAQFTFAQSTITGRLSDIVPNDGIPYTCVLTVGPVAVGSAGGTYIDQSSASGAVKAIPFKADSVVLATGDIGGDVTLENTNFSGTISSKTVHTSNIVILGAIGDNAAAYAGGVHSK